MIHSGLFTSKNEEFPALPKSRPISFGSSATRVSHSLGDHDGPAPDNSRKKRMKKKKKHSRVDGSNQAECQKSSKVLDSGVVHPLVSVPDSEMSFPLASHSDESESHVAQDTFVYGPSHPQELKSVRTIDDEGFVDDVESTAAQSKFASTTIDIAPENNNRLTLIQQHSTACFETTPIMTRTSLISPAPKSSSTLPPPHFVRNKEADSVCASYENKNTDHHVFDGIEVPRLWDSVVSRVNCCGGLPGGDEANGMDHLATDSGSTTNRDAGTNKKAPSGIGDHHHLGDLEEDEMEGTDLLHLISNSLDRFNAIVHPDDLSGLTSGLGASEALLSDLDRSLPDSQVTPGTVKGRKTFSSVEEFTDNRTSWIKSRLTASSCPNSYSLNSSSIRFSNRSDAFTPPVPSCPTTTLLSDPCRSPCIEDTTFGMEESVPTSINLSQLNTHCSQLVPDSAISGTQSLSSSTESELIYPSMPSVQIRQSLSSQNDPNSALNPTGVISTANPNTANTSCGFTFPVTGLDPVTSWTTVDKQAITTNNRATPMQPSLNRSIGSSITTVSTTTTTSDGFLYQMEHSYKYPTSGSLSNSRLDCNTLTRGLDWLSVRHPASTGLTGNGLLSSVPTADGSVATSPGLAVCANRPLGFNPVSGMESALDTTILLSRDQFLASQRSASQQQQPSATVTQGSSCGKSVLSTCLTSDFSWDLKSLDIWSNLYPAYGRRTRPTTAGLGLNRNRLPHSDSVAFSGSLTDFNFGSRRASMSVGVPFDFHDLVTSDQESVASVYGNTASAGSDGISETGVLESIKCPVASEPNVTTSLSYPPLPHQSPDASFVAAESPMRLVGRSGAMNGISNSPDTNNALPGPQSHHGSWSTGWLAKSPLLRVTHSENYRHGLAHKRYNHPLSRPGGDRSVELTHFPTILNRSTARGPSPCHPAFQPVTSRLLHAPFNVTPRGASSTISSAAPLSSSTSSSSTSSSCGSLTTSNSRPTPNTTEVAAELGRPVVAKWRRACSFYLRGHCKKEDCEFAHDLTKVTCKFWEMGECFKGPTCPFLHGYPPELNDTSL